MDALTAAVTGAGLGLAGGLAPGPLTVLVVTQTLRHGSREGLKVALAPVLTDGPLLIASAAFASALAGLDVALGWIGVLGALFLVYLGVEAMRTTAVEVDDTADGASIGKAIATNLLNPHPYVFWVGVGGPLVASAWSHSLAATGAFLVAFFGVLCGSKAVLALGVGRASGLLSGPAYLWTVRATGLLMWVFAAGFAWDAVRRLSGIAQG